MVERILITVKTYPHPSNSYQELVCTAGVRENGSFVRLYPIDFRYLSFDRKFKKYQWIEVDIEKNPKDPRPESYRPHLESIKLLERLDTKNGWAERKKYVLAQPLQTMCQLRKMFKQNHTSLGIIKPKQIFDLEVKPDTPNWDDKHLNALKQLNLFRDKKPLEKIPYRFSYRFDCGEPQCPGHTMSITDWELGVLYLNERERYKDGWKAVESVKHKFWNELCGKDKDTYFFVGNTRIVCNTWIVLGVFYPPKEAQSTTPSLFGK